MTLRFYDRGGKSIDVMQWSDLMEDREYAKIADVWIEEPTLRVSTIWRGGPFSSFSTLSVMPIFETIIFGADDEILHMYHYLTEAQAIAGHDQAVVLAREMHAISR